VEAAIVGDEAVDLAFYISGLGPDAAAAGVALNLLAEFAEQDVGAVVVGVEVIVDLVRLVDAEDGLLNLPETGGEIRDQTTITSNGER
jgi:hypothetical protein